MAPTNWGSGATTTNTTVTTKSASRLQAKSAGSGGTARGYSSTQVFSTYAGAAQADEPNHCGTAGGASSWASVQAAENGIMTIDTDGSNFDTILAVYIGNGNDFSSLVSVACDVGSGRGGTNSRVTFAATSNTLYYVAVDGVYGAYGTVVLNWNLAVPPTITAWPTSQTVSAGGTVVLTAAASGHPAPVCQWWCDGLCLNGATNGSLTITNFLGYKEGSYRMVAANPLGSAVAGPAALLLNSQLRLDSFTCNPSNHTLQMRVVGVANSNYVLQASTNLLTWIPIATNSAPTGFCTFSDGSAPACGRRFYRVIPD